MGAHLVDGTFQSDKYPTTPLGKVPLSVKDPAAQDLLWLYAQRHRSVDAEFSNDLETALKNAGYEPPPPDTHLTMLLMRFLPSSKEPVSMPCTFVESHDEDD